MTLKLRAKVNFPATVTANGGLQVVKSNGIWTVSPDWTDLTLETVIPDASARQLWTLDPVSNIYYRLSVQALIDNLPAGPPGSTGPVGPTPGIHQAYSATTTDSDPGAGVFRLNHATPASATAAYLDNLDNAGATVSGIIDRFDDSTNTIKGMLRIEKSGDASIWAEFNVTGSVVDGTGYRKLTLASGAGSGTFTAADLFAISFTRAGDKGADGAGTGDFSSNTASSVDGEIVLFSGTGGKTGKRATGSGLAKLTSGVLSTASSGTDYAPATSGSAILKGNGAGGFSSATAGTDYLDKGTTSLITVGYTVTPNNIGTVSSGTTTPAAASGNYQYLTNNGAFTLAVPAADCAIDLLVTNGASAGSITFSGYTVGSSTGDALTTTNTSKFIISIRRINSVATYTIKALQ